MYFIDTQRDIIYYIHDVKYDVTYIRFIGEFVIFESVIIN